LIKDERRDIAMMLDRRDIELLRLAGKYRWLPYDSLDLFGLPGLAATAEALSINDYLSIARNRRYMTPAPRGYEYLEHERYAYDATIKRAYANSPILRRRLETSEIMLTCLRAGIDVLRDEVDALRDQPVFFPAFDFRSGDVNVMNNAACAGFGHFGGGAYMFHYAGPENGGMYLLNELGVFHRLASVFAEDLGTPLALIFAGTSYRRIHTRLFDTPLSKRHGVRGFIDFAEIYRRSELPVHLLSCDETGATQLALMRQPEYNAKIARTAYGAAWRPRDDQIPDADGSVGGNPLVIAADMDIRRAAKVIDAARRLGKAKVMIAAFQSQLDDFLMDIFPPDDMTVHFCIDRQILEAAFQNGLTLYDGAPAWTPGGDESAKTVGTYSKA
jgi:hypothetical protein